MYPLRIGDDVDSPLSLLSTEEKRIREANKQKVKLTIWFGLCVLYIERRWGYANYTSLEAIFGPGWDQFSYA